MASVIDGSASATFQTPLPVSQGGTGAASGAGAAAALAPIQLGSTQNTTSGTTVDVTTVPAGVRRITIVPRAVSTNGTSSLMVQIGSGSFATTGYASTASGCYSGNVISGLAFTNGFGLAISAVAANVHHGSVTLIHMGGNVWQCSSILNASVSNAGAFTGSGDITLSGVLDRVRFTTANGTDAFDNGSVSFLWEF